MTKVPCRNSDVLTRSVYTHRTASYQERGWKEVSLKNDQGVWIFSYGCFQVSRLRSEMRVLIGQWLVWTLPSQIYWSTSVTYGDLLLVSFSLQSLGPSVQSPSVSMKSQQAIETHIEWILVMTEAVLPSVVRHWSQREIMKLHEWDLCS